MSPDELVELLSGLGPIVSHGDATFMVLRLDTSSQARVAAYTYADLLRASGDDSHEAIHAATAEAFRVYGERMTDDDGNIRALA